MKARVSLLGVLYRLFEGLASLKLAVVLILSLAVVLAVGTIYESKYGAPVASREVYRSGWMQILLWLFMFNLAAAAMSRLPWRRSHIGFLITHLGIITLLLGSWITQRRGIDGTMALEAGESARAARVDEDMLYVFRNVGGSYDLVLNQALDLDPRRGLTKPLTFTFLEGTASRKLEVLRYIPKATRIVRAQDVPSSQGVPALKFTLSGSRATFSDWLFLEADTGTTRELGPAVIKLANKKPDLSLKPAKPTLVLYFDEHKDLPPLLAVARKGEAFRALGRVKPGQPLALGWMDFSFTLNEFHASATPQADYLPLDDAAAGPRAESVEVLEARLGDQPLWLELGSSDQVSLNDAIYYVQFTKRQVDLGFDLKLKKFHIGYDEGTSNPASYASDVEVAGANHTISMNEPLKYNGFTVYQSSYESDPDGTPRYSVLSVNLDPGRPVKYAGSLMIVFGIISMFYFKPVYSGKSNWLAKKEAV